MTFVSTAFLLFISAVTTAYFIVPAKYRWTVLLISSWIFFWINSKWLLLVHIFTSLFTFGIGLWMEKIMREGKAAAEDDPGLSKEERRSIRENTRRKTKRVLWFGIVIDLGVLLFLKYWNFFANSVNAVSRRAGISFPLLDLLLPIGISFYTLQAIAYLTDISRGKISADRDPAKFMLFMSYFPQIVQGPIPRYHQLAHQLYEGHRFDYSRLCQGIQLMLWGWFKKLVIADRAAIAVSAVFDAPGEFHGLIIFFAAALYGIQIYTDFSGGMDIARGFSQIIGIDLELNFRQPYFSGSVEEFWRRWHITLGSWMRDYVFYPLSLSKGFASLSKRSRKIFGSSFGKKLPAFLSMFIVYFLVGFWHGPNWKYIAYGLWNGLFIMSGILLSEVYEKARKICRIDEASFGWRLFRMIRTFVLCSLGRYFVRSVSLKTAFVFFRNTARSWKDLSFILDGTLTRRLELDTANWILLALTIMLLLLVDLLHEKGIRIRETISRQWIVFRWIIYIAAILSILAFGLYGPGYDASSFIYQQF